MKFLLHKGFNAIQHVLSALFLALIVFACKDPEPPRAEITVLRQDGVPVEDARVIMLCVKPGCIVADTQYTNFNGQTTHEFDLPAVLKAEAFKVNTNTIDTGFPPRPVVIGSDSLCGEEFVTLVEDEVTRKEIIVTSCN